MDNKTIEALEKLVEIKNETIKELEKQIQLLKNQPSISAPDWMDPNTLRIPIQPLNPFPFVSPTPSTPNWIISGSKLPEGSIQAIPNASGNITLDSVPNASGSISIANVPNNPNAIWAITNSDGLSNAINWHTASRC